MEIKEIMNNVNDFFAKNVAPPHKITSVEAGEEQGWKVRVEVIEEKEYMKRYAKDQMLGVYNVVLNDDKEVTSFTREDIRYRSKIEN